MTSDRAELFCGFTPCGWAEFQTLAQENRRTRFTMPGVDDAAILHAAHGVLSLEFAGKLDAWRVTERFLKDGGFWARDHLDAFDKAREFYSALLFNATRTQCEDVNEAYPAAELIRVGKKRERIDWNERWAAAGGTFYGARMIATLNDPVWAKLSVMGLPYPPFDFGSRMDWREISARAWESCQIAI